MSQSADNMRRKGIDKFNMFLTSKDMGAWDNLLPEQFTIELLQQFGTFMCHFLMKEDGSGYSLASIEKYLSGVTNAAQEDVRFKCLDLWKDKNWYTRLRAAINKSIILNALKKVAHFQKRGLRSEGNYSSVFVTIIFN